jgi:hypothetical protein
LLTPVRTVRADGAGQSECVVAAGGNTPGEISLDEGVVNPKYVMQAPPAWLSLPTTSSPIRMNW